MSRIVGAVRFDGGPASPGEVSALLATAYADEKPSVLESGAAVLATLGVQPEGGLFEGDDASGGACPHVVCDARLDSLSSDGGPGPEASAGERIAQALSAQGPDVIHGLVGDFAFASWDPARRALSLARDAMSMRSLYFAPTEGGVLFASEAGQLRSALGRGTPVNPDAVAAFLAGAPLGADQSFFQDVARVRPGSLTTLTSGGATVTRRLQPSVVPDGASEAEAVEEFWRRFSVSVADRVRGGEVFGLMLSGGADSTAIGVALADLGSDSGLTGRAYSWAFEKLADGDERAVAARVAAAAGLPLVAIPGDDAWPLKHPTRDGPLVDGPFIWPFQELNDRAVAAAASDGAAVVLTGDRGDATVGDWVFHADRSPPQPAPPPFLSPELAERARALWRGAEVPAGPAPQRGARIYGWAVGQIAEMNARMYRRQGVVYADPWSDVRVADWVLGLPAEWVNRPDERKRILRRALAARGFDPSGLATREPAALFDRGLRMEGASTVRSLMASPVAADLGFVDGGALREAMEQYISSGRATFDVWKPVALELWLRRLDDPRTAP